MVICILGFREETLTDRLKSRFTERFVLDRYLSQNSGITFMSFAFAHELGHVIQFDPNFNAYFGPIDQHPILPKDGYSLYIESDFEIECRLYLRQLLWVIQILGAN